MKRKALSLKTLSLKTLAVAATLALSSTAALSVSAADAPAAQAPSTHQPLLWKVSDGDNSLYLLGSLHLLKKSDYPLSPDVDAALRDAKTVIFELDMDEVMKPDSLAKLARAAASRSRMDASSVMRCRHRPWPSWKPCSRKPARPCRRCRASSRGRSTCNW